MMTKKSVEIFIAIKLFERFKEISLSHQSEPLSIYSDETIINILKETEIDFKYFKKENFYGVKLIESNYDIRFNISFKYGIVEPILWAKNMESGEQIGGVFSRLMKMIQKSTNNSQIIKIAYPKFSNYEDLKEIILELSLIFKDFKKELLKKTST